MRTAVAAAVVALPLLATGSAQAAIAGGNPASTALPDLSSATILSTSSVEVCFDKAVNQNGNQLTNASGVGGYRSGRLLRPASVNPESGKSNCFVANFPTTSSGNQVDLNQFTIYEVGTNVVTAQSGGGQNLPDSTTLNGSTTHNGTTALSTAPDLTGVAPYSTTNTSNNSVTYVFDQNVDNGSNGGAAPLAAGFWLEDASGALCRGLSATVSGTSVTVTFSTASGYASSCNINNAVRAGVDPRSVDASADPHSPNARQTTTINGAANGAATALPDLTSAALGPNANQISYTFDKPVNASTVHADEFEAWMSNDTVLTGQTTNVGSSSNSSSTIVVTFNNLQQQNEYAVIAGVGGNAVQDTNGDARSNGCGAGNNIPSSQAPCNGTDPGGRAVGTSNTNSPGSAPIGDNLGAFARGYTTGADIYAVTINKTNGVVSIALDQRATPTNFSRIDLVNSQGQQTAFNSFNTSCSPSGLPANPGPETLNCQFTAAEVSNAIAVEAYADAFQTGLSNSQVGEGNGYDLGADDDSFNVAQIIAPVGSSAHLKAAKVHKAKKHAKKHRKYSKKH